MRRHLFVAAERGDDEAVITLLDRGVLVDKQDKRGRTALMYAAEHGHVHTLELLLERGAEVEATDEGGRTALMYAAMNGHLDAMHVLLDHSADVNAADAGGGTPLMYAASWTHDPDAEPPLSEAPTHPVELLLDRRASVHARDANGRTALFFAGVEGARILLRAGPDVDARDAADTTRLLAGRLQPGMARLLLDNGAEIRERDPNGETVLLRSLMWFRLDGAPSEGPARLDEVRGIDEAELEFPYDDVSLFLQRGVDVDAHGRWGQTALIRAATHGLTEPVWLLLKYGAAVEERDENGRTALMQAALYDRRDIVRLLLDHGADVEAKDQDGHTALSLAENEGNLAVVRMLSPHT